MSKIATPIRFIKKGLYLLPFLTGHLLCKLLPPPLIDGLRTRKVGVRYKNNLIFIIEDMGRITRYRANTFTTKEPETLEWIEGFEERECLLDVGANIGVYTLFALSKNHSVIAIEPEAQNFNLLNRNIYLNKFKNNIITLPLALNDKQIISTLNLSSCEYGSALHSFGRAKDQFGQEFDPVNQQGVLGLTMDELLDSLNKKINHLKIDVDGNEFLVLKGGLRTLECESLKSILIELDIYHPEYNSSVSLLKSYGFKQTFPELDKNKSNSNLRVDSRIYNHIFKRG